MTWVAPALSPTGQVGDSFNISHILYTVKDQDVILQSSPHIINHAEVTGYADTGGLGLEVHAETNYPTFIMMPIVGGYTVRINAAGISTPTIFYVALVLSMAAFFIAYRRNAANTISVLTRPKKQRKPNETNSRTETR